MFSGVSLKIPNWDEIEEDPDCCVDLECAGNLERWISLRRGSEVSPSARQRIVLGIKVLGLESNFLSFRRDFIRLARPRSLARD